MTRDYIICELYYCELHVIKMALLKGGKHVAIKKLLENIAIRSIITIIKIKFLYNIFRFYYKKSIMQKKRLRIINLI